MFVHFAAVVAARSCVTRLPVIVGTGLQLPPAPGIPGGREVELPSPDIEPSSPEPPSSPEEPLLDPLLPDELDPPDEPELEPDDDPEPLPEEDVALPLDPELLPDDEPLPELDVD